MCEYCNVFTLLYNGVAILFLHIDIADGNLSFRQQMQDAIVEFEAQSETKK